MGTRPQSAHNPAVDFQTPPQALEPLLPYLRPHWHIWEPACGDGNLANTLMDRGYKVTDTDIKRWGDQCVDFLNPKECRNILYHYDSVWNKHEDRMEEVAVSARVHAIVTNPPYSRGNMDGFLVRCFELGLPFALLVPLTALEGASKRIPAYVEANPRPQVIVMGRVRFTTPTGLQGMDSNPTFGVCWLTWKLGLPHDLMWWHEGDLR